MRAREMTGGGGSGRASRFAAAAATAARFEARFSSMVHPEITFNAGRKTARKLPRITEAITSSTPKS